MHLLSQASVRIWPKNWSAGWTRSIGACKFVDPTYAWRGKLFVAASHLSLAPQVMLIWETNQSPQGTRECTRTEITEGIAADVVHGSGFSNLFREPLRDGTLCTQLKGKAVPSPFFFRTMRTLQLIRQLRRPLPLETEWRPLGRLAMTLWGKVDMIFLLAPENRLSIFSSQLSCLLAGFRDLIDLTLEMRYQI